MVTKYGKNTPTKPTRLGLDVLAEIEKQAIYGETSPNQVLRRILKMNKKATKKAEQTEKDKKTARKL